jgi:large subunit ribosomal protein L4
VAYNIAITMDATLYNAKGKEEGKLTLPETVFGVAWNNDLVHQVVTAMQANARTPVAHTKFRSEVSGTGKKPWKQKGTGSARHGSRRSPIWRKGGVAHGPRSERDYGQKINKKMRVKALYTVLSKKLVDGEVLFLDALTFDAPKTKEAKTIITALAKIKGFEKLATKRKNTACIATIDLSDAAVKSFRNFGNLSLNHIRNLNPATLLENKYVVLVGGKDAVEELARRAGTKETK